MMIRREFITYLFDKRTKLIYNTSFNSIKHTRITKKVCICLCHQRENTLCKFGGGAGMKVFFLVCFFLLFKHFE